MSIVQEEDVMVRDQDVKELKDGIKELATMLREVDKTVTVHTEKFNTLGNIKETTERTSESAKSAHKRIDQVESEFRQELEEIRKTNEKQFNDFKELVEASNKVHTENYQSIKSFAWKVFFLFASPFAVGLVGLFWLIFNKGAGLK
ncbi:hypothetical protein BN1002_04745 [Bacillus sp. B-jedd]|nr:hypothetical protein BN1002_04745 [Bacillus sp. B-jedd]